MANRCLNKVMLIGNLTRDPELRYTPSGTAVVTLGLATNRRWKTQAGDYKDDAQFHRVVAWNKLAELCSQLLKKGSRIYIEGRIQYRDWEDNEGNKRQTTEVVAGDLIILDSRSASARPENADVQVGQNDQPSQPLQTMGEDMDTKESQGSAPASQGGIQTTEDKQKGESVSASPVSPPEAVSPVDDLAIKDKKAAPTEKKDKKGASDKDKKEGGETKKDMPF